MDDVYPEIAIGQNPLDGLDAYENYWFEIGFGGAEHLLWQAQHNPNIAVLGAEPYLNGVAKAVMGVKSHALCNVFLHHGDARHVLARLPDAVLDCVFVLFPDPWPKARHKKRRIISEDFLHELYRVIKPGGRFRFASDITDYVDWTLTRVYRHGGFSWPVTQMADWRQRPEDWPSTRYLEKALREGRAGHFFEFKRQG